ncbi:MAG: DUF885 family protein [Imperialibacter sp.]|uniref:DUF885 family protein n=1 Tax=Imperialibacter sp. TaxID=2038411 RepID=UPI003A8B62EF
MKKTLLLFFFSLFMLSGFSQALYEQTSEVNNLMVRYDADYGSLHRFYYLDSSPERIERLKTLDQDYLRQLEAMDFNALATGARVDYLLFRRDVQEDLRTLTLEGAELAAVKQWLPFAPYLYEIENLRRRGNQLEWQEVAKKLTDTGDEIEAITTKLKAAEPFDQKLTKRASASIKGIQEGIKSIHSFYNEYDPLYTWWVTMPITRVDSLLTIYEKVMTSKAKLITTQKDDGSGIVGSPIGRDEIIKQLEFEMIPYTPDQLIDLANKEFAWCDAELLKASREMGFGDDWKAAQEKVKNSYVPVGQQPEAMMELYNQSMAFLKEHDLVTIPPIAEESWRMTMMAAERQKVSPFFLGGENFIISYPTNTMEYDDRMMSMRGNNPHFSRSTVHHELIAGHHLQGFMNRRYKTYRHFRTPFWTEGWALYWELLLWDMDFPRSPEDRIGMLFWRMHRCARIIFSLNYHMGKWSPQQCIDFLVDRVGHERANAEGEVRRSFTGGYGPLYQVAYLTGGLQFYALKKELVDGGQMTLKQYHNAVLHENAMPVEMVRAILTNQTLPKDFKTSWRFYH